jgi:hypothetical protein
MRNRSCIDSIVDYKSAVYLSIYRGGGLDPLQTNFRAYPLILANNRSTKLGTLIYSAHARTVRPTGADCPDRGPSGLRAGPSARSIWCSTHRNNRTRADLVEEITQGFMGEESPCYKLYPPNQQRDSSPINPLVSLSTKSTLRPCSVISVSCGLKCIGMDLDGFLLVMNLNRLNITQFTWINGETNKS